MVTNGVAGGTPVPVRESVPLAFPLILSVPVLAPSPPGVKVNITVQVAAGATVPALVQVPPVRAKSAAFVPVIVKNGVLSTRLALPTLVITAAKPELVTLCVWFPNATGLGAIDTEGVAGGMPVPVRLSVAEALPFTVNSAVSDA